MVCSQNFPQHMDFSFPFPSCHCQTTGDMCRPTSQNLWTFVFPFRFCKSVLDLSSASPLQSDPARSNSEYLRTRVEYISPLSTYFVKVGQPVHLITEGLLACMRPPDCDPLCSVQVRHQVYRPQMFHLSASQWSHHLYLLCCHSLDYYVKMRKQ